MTQINSFGQVPRAGQSCGAPGHCASVPSLAVWQERGAGGWQSRAQLSLLCQGSCSRSSHHGLELLQGHRAQALQLCRAGDGLKQGWKGHRGGKCRSRAEL